MHSTFHSEEKANSLRLEKGYGVGSRVYSDEPWCEGVSEHAIKTRGHKALGGREGARSRHGHCSKLGVPFTKYTCVHFTSQSVNEPQNDQQTTAVFRGLWNTARGFLSTHLSFLIYFLRLKYMFYSLSHSTRRYVLQQLDSCYSNNAFHCLRLSLWGLGETFISA